MSDTLQTALAPGDDRLRRLLYVLAGLVAVGALVFAVQLQSGAKIASHFTVRNDTPFELTIAASSTPGGAVTPVGIAPRDATTTFAEVIDEGRIWYFHVTCSGRDAGTITRTRASLAEAGWKLEVDGDASARCRAAGLVPD